MAPKKDAPTTRKILVTISAEDEAVIDKWRERQVIEPPLGPTLVRLARLQAEAELAKKKAA